MKKFIVLIAALFLTTAAHATQQGKVEKIFDASTVAGTGSTITSRVFNVGSVQSMGYWLKLEPNSTNQSYKGSNVALYMQASYDDTAANFATVSTISYATNSAATAGTLAFPAMKYVRFRATGLTGQATDSTITAYLFTQD